MNWNNVKLIFGREMRDQLRDRRTLFLIAVMPLLLYPLMGMSFFQMTQFLRKKAAKVMVVGAEELHDMPWLPKLFEGDRFHSDLISNPQERENLQVVWPTDTDSEQTSPAADDSKEEHSDESQGLELARRQLSQGDVQLVLYFPTGFGQRLRAARLSLENREQSRSAADRNVDLPQPQLLSNSANETSQMAHLRVERVLRQWSSLIAQKNLSDNNVPLDVANPFQLQSQDVAQERQRLTAVWSKILPFVLFIWALTGAFYPAIDLCAGEKERGTLETLLASPAQRREIVWGKLLTITLFSMVTALLNLASMGLTGKFVLSQLGGIPGLGDAGSMAMPPLVSVLWLVVGLVPISAMFSALCLALAAFARSTKEGQYYLMPLVLVTLPLMLLPMAPGVELNLGNSLIPVTGVVLLLRSMIEGQYATALPYVLPVVGMTLMCCLLAIRWAEEQFSRESVLFRESERLDLGRWLTHLVRDRTDTPSLPQAIFCLVTILVVQFFISLALTAKSAGGIDFTLLVQMLFISQVVCILLPPVLMALLFTRRRKKTLLLDRMPAPAYVAIAALLAVVVHPLGIKFTGWVQQLYPSSPEIVAQMQDISQAMASAPYWWIPILLMAVLPAVCEEIAFRGFILSGLRHVGHKWWAIVGTSIAFGAVHPFLPQKISAAAVGIVLGILAVQTASLVPCMVFHALYNTLGLAVVHLAEKLNDGEQHPLLQAILQANEDSVSYRPWVLGVCAIGAAMILWWLHRVPYERTHEEQLQEIRERQGMLPPMVKEM